MSNGSILENIGNHQYKAYGESDKDFKKRILDNLHKENPNECQCKGKDGKPLNQCNECPR